MTRRFNDEIRKLEQTLTNDELQVLLKVRLNFIAYCQQFKIEDRVYDNPIISEMFMDYFRDQIDFHEALEMYEICHILKSIDDKIRQILTP